MEEGGWRRRYVRADIHVKHTKRSGAVVSLQVVSALSNSLRIVPAALILACAPRPIIWKDPVEEPAFDSSKYHVVVREAAGRAYVDSSRLKPPVVPNQCSNSVRTYWDDSFHPYAVWWSLRSDSTADLVASSTTDGRRWSAPVRIDTADVAKVGCRRPPPALFSEGDNVHVAYSMRAGEGPGIFLAHSMDRGRTFHSPVAVAYGEKLGLASVAANGNFVIVAYEDPNTTPTRISIALSTTMAHLFEYREVISPEDMAASQPFVYTPDGKHVTLTWRRAADSTKQIRVDGTVR